MTLERSQVMDSQMGGLGGAASPDVPPGELLPMREALSAPKPGGDDTLSLSDTLLRLKLDCQNRLTFARQQRARQKEAERIAQEEATRKREAARQAAWQPVLAAAKHWLLDSVHEYISVTCPAAFTAESITATVSLHVPGHHPIQVRLARHQSGTWGVVPHLPPMGDRKEQLCDADAVLTDAEAHTWYEVSRGVYCGTLGGALLHAEYSDAELPDW